MKTPMFIQNLEGQTKSIMVVLKVAHTKREAGLRNVGAASMKKANMETFGTNEMITNNMGAVSQSFN